jgi:hypothetical protein
MSEPWPVRLPVNGLDGELHAWFLPRTRADRLLGFELRTPDGRSMRVSSFERQPGRWQDCPLAADWLDPEQVRARAAALAAPGEAAGEPRLSFDGVIDRLAWAVPLHAAGGRQRWIFVAGTVAWSGPTADGGVGGVGGGVGGLS